MKISYSINTETKLFSIQTEITEPAIDKISFYPEEKKKQSSDNILLKGFVSTTVPIILKSDKYFYVNQDRETKKIHSMFGSPMTMNITGLSRENSGTDATNLPPKLRKTVLTTDQRFELYMKGDITSLALDLDKKRMDGKTIAIPVRLTTNSKNSVKLWATHYAPREKVLTIDHGEKVVIYTKFLYDIYKFMCLILTTTDTGELEFVSEANFNNSIFRFIKYNSVYNPLQEEYHIHDVNQFVQTKNKLSPPFTFSDFKLDDSVLIESFLYTFLGFESFLFTFNLSNFKFTSIKELGKHKNRIVHFRSRIYLEGTRIKNPIFYAKISKLILVLNKVSIVREFPLLFNNPDHGMIVQKFCNQTGFLYLQKIEEELVQFISQSPSMNSLVMWTENNLTTVTVILEILSNFENESIRPVSILNSIYSLMENQPDANKKRVLEEMFKALSSDLVHELVYLMKYGYCKLSFDYIQKQMANISRYSIMFWDYYSPLDVDKIPRYLLNQYDNIIDITKYNTIFNTSDMLTKDNTYLELHRKLDEYKYTSVEQFKTFVMSLTDVLKNSFKSFCDFNNYLQNGVPYFHNCSSLYQGNLLNTFFANSKEYLLRDVKKLLHKDYRLKLESILTKEYRKCSTKYLTSYMKEAFEFVVKFDTKIITKRNKYAFHIMTIQCKALWPFSALIPSALSNNYSTLSNKVINIQFRLFLLDTILFEDKKEVGLAFSLRSMFLGILEFYYIAVNNEVFYNTFDKLLQDEKWDTSVLRLEHCGSSIGKKSFMKTKFLSKGISGLYYITDRLIEFKTNEYDIEEEMDCVMFLRETVKIKDYFNTMISKLLEKSNVEKELKFLSSCISI